MIKKLTKYPSKCIKANENAMRSPGACYIDNYSRYNRPYNTLENIVKMVNRCLAGSNLELSDIDSVGIADNGQLLGFYSLYKTESGNYYDILWTRDGWKIHIYDALDEDALLSLAKVMHNINETFNGVKFHEDRPIINK